MTDPMTACFLVWIFINSAVCFLWGRVYQSGNHPWKKWDTETSTFWAVVLSIMAIIVLYAPHFI